MTKNLIIDCDGVLYPLSDLSVSDFVTAMKIVYRDDLHISGEEQMEISAKTIRENHLGLFNYIREMCYYRDYDFGDFCKKMCDHIDYSSISPDKELLKTLLSVSDKNRVFIWTNNSREHLEKVSERLFSKNLAFLENKGIGVFDITVMEQNGYFQPKQSEKGFEMFLQKIAAKPEDCVLFDDTPRNIKIASQNGVKGILISQDNTLKDNLKVYFSPDYVTQKAREKD